MYIDMDSEMLAKHFSENLLYTNRGYNYYVDWENISGYDDFSIELNAMNVLIKCQDFYNTFCELLKKLPSVILVFPYLISLAKAERQALWKGKTLMVIGSEIDSDDFQEYCFSISNIKKGLSESQINNFYNFFEQMGLKYLFENLIEKSVVDYVIGVLVGLDSNGRKNRGGKAFELACE
jgi:type II restriction enzyme